MSVNIAVNVDDVIVLSRNKLCWFFFQITHKMSEFCVLLISTFFWQHKVNMKVEKDGKKIALLVGLSQTSPRPTSCGWMVYGWVVISNFSAINLQENFPQPLSLDISQYIDGIEIFHIL